jgi:hypothetical protein
MITAAKRNQSDAESRELEELTEYGDIFAMKRDDYRRTDRVYHSIERGGQTNPPSPEETLAKQEDMGEMLKDMQRRVVE